jgi:hypothetical protein
LLLPFVESTSRFLVHVEVVHLLLLVYLFLLYFINIISPFLHVFILKGIQRLVHAKHKDF